MLENLPIFAALVFVVLLGGVANETTALGAAFLAGLQSGIFESLTTISELWQREKVFEPTLEEEVISDQGLLLILSHLT